MTTPEIEMSTKQAIVIGTGAGGLTAAVGLAQAGFEVLALERGQQLGGFLNPFKRRNFHFDPGVHYVGQCDSGGDMFRVLDRCGVDVASIMAPMDENCFDLLRFPDCEVRVPKGVERYRQHLIDLFPSDRSDIDKCFKAMDAFRPLLRSDSGRGRKLLGLPAVARLATLTFGQFLEQTFKNPKLRCILGAQCGDYGVPPSRAPALLGLGLILHFLDGGAYFPRGGSGSLRDALVHAGRKLGVVYKRRAEVAQILTERGKVSGVTLTGGERFPADVVVSCVDPTLTYGRFLSKQDVPRKLQNKVERNLPSVGSLCLYYGMNRDLREHGLGAFNVWDYPTWDVENAFGYALEGEDMPSDYAFFLSPNSLKDDSGQMAPEGMSTLEVVTLAPFAPFEKWADQKALKRGDDYNAFKTECAERLRASVDRRWPGLVGDVVVEDASTPVTNMHFAGVVDGGIYGPAPVSEQFGLHAYRTKSPVDGLFLAGAGVFGPGVAPCLISGMKAARAAAKAGSKRFGWLPTRGSELARS
jgi:phytoene dehydrogenase-like protein